MVKKFIFKVGNDTLFQGDLHSMRCEGQTKSGQRCKRKTVIGLPYCWTHLEIDLHLKIKNSTIPNSGKGVFAKDKTKEDDEIPVVFKPKELITEYKGETITQEEKTNRYGQYTAPYAVHKTVEDASLKRGIG